MQRVNNEHIKQTIAHLRLLQVYLLRPNSMPFSIHKACICISSEGWVRRVVLATENICPISILHDSCRVQFYGMYVIVDLENIWLVMIPLTFSSQYVRLFSVRSQLLPQSTQVKKHSIFASFISIQIECQQPFYYLDLLLMHKRWVPECSWSCVVDDTMFGFLSDWSEM